MMDEQQPLGQLLKLSDKELMKELLYILRVKGDIDKISDSAIKEFGSLRAILAKSSEDLKQIKGFTPAIIKRLKVIYSLFKEIIRPEEYPTEPIQIFEGLSYFRHTAPKFDGECLRLLYLDENQAILKDFIYKKGSGNQVKFYFREIVREVLTAGISNLVMIHHKIGTSLNPTQMDHQRFKKFNASFKALDLKLVDYLIISDNAIFSYKHNELYPRKPLLKS
jgi:DNA repair protein RadC